MSLAAYLQQVEAGISAAEEKLPEFFDKARQGLALLKEVEPFISMINPAAAAVVDVVEKIATPVVDAIPQ